MISHAYSLAENLIIKYILSGVYEIGLNTEKEELHLINFEGRSTVIDDTSTNIPDNFLSRFEIMQEILDTKYKNTIEWALAYKVLQKLLEEVIVSAEINGGRLVYYAHGKKETCQLDENYNLMHRYRNLVAADLIMQDYSITEYAGSKFFFQTPNQKYHTTTRYDCDCHEFKKVGSRKGCPHVEFVNVIGERVLRKPLVEKGLLKIIP